jgi:hypothetical protein
MEPEGPARVERRLAAILAADVAGYSRLIEADEEGTLGRFKALRAELIDPKVAHHRGRIVKTTGDGLLVEFASVVDALRCAPDVQTASAQSNAVISPDRRIAFRIGINVGDIFGDGVNAAARLEGLAEPGGICVSARVRENAMGRLDHSPTNALDFQIEEYAKRYPFTYGADEMPDLLRSIERQYLDPEHEVDRWARQFLRHDGRTDTSELLAAMTQAIRHDLTYVAREESGVQDPVKTLRMMSGSCRDFAVLMMEGCARSGSSRAL